MSLFQMLSSQLGFIPQLLAGKKPEDALKGAVVNTGLAMTGANLIPGADPISAYLTTGASEGSTLANALTGAGGSAGAVGQGSTAGTLQSLLNGGKDAMGYMKTVGDAAGAANSIRQATASQPMQAPPMMQQQPRGDTLAQMLQQQAELEAMRRKQQWSPYGAA